MDRRLEIASGGGPAFETYLKHLAALYADMDRAYRRNADRYGFDCRGCEDSCCRTRFYHHTLVEVLYLRQGLARLSRRTLGRVQNAAQAVIQRMAQADALGKPARAMCPLNFKGLCALYAYRPMICRLHGIPHHLDPPGRPRQMGPGCDAFDRACGHLAYLPFDRTPFYGQLAQLEQQIRHAAGYQGRIRLTIAEMIAGAGTAGRGPGPAAAHLPA